VHLVFRDFHGFSLKVIAFRYRLKPLLDKLWKIRPKYPLAVFGCSHRMVARLVDSVTRSIN